MSEHLLYSRKYRMSTINEIQDEIIEEFSALEDWMDRYALIIDLGNTLEPLPESDKTPTNIIEGCQSRVWITALLTREARCTSVGRVMRSSSRGS